MSVPNVNYKLESAKSFRLGPAYKNSYDDFNFKKSNFMSQKKQQTVSSK